VVAVTDPARFLAEHGFAGVAPRPFPGDASHRAYARVGSAGAGAVLMRTTAADARDFARIAIALREAGLAAPAILAADPDAGLLLVEDFGPHTLADRLDAGEDPVPLYAAAAAALAALHAAAPPAWLPAWDAATMTGAAAIFLDWWWPAALGAAATEALRAEFDHALRTMLAPFAPIGWVHRDFFPPNLVPQAGRIGLLDFQDAAIGHPAYDLVSLIEDARRDVSPAARRAALAAYGPAPCEAAMAALGAHRHLRVAGLWVRLARRDGRPGYLRHGPRTWAHLTNSLRHPAAAPLRDFLDRHVPCDIRGNPPPRHNGAASE
jgi:N-acetylmuramate 1-kinase